MGDAEYMLAFERLVLPVSQMFAPDLVLVSCGFDAARGDPLGGYDVTPECYAMMTRMLMTGLPSARGRVVLALEGGYNLDSIKHSALACVRALRGEPISPLRTSPPRPSAIRCIERSREALLHEDAVESARRRDILQVARFLSQSGSKPRVVVLAGAGVSTSAGIPDFRSPGGMYDTLKPELLTATQEQKARMETDPTHVVQWSLFQHNPLPYLEVRRPFILQIAQRKWKPTISHYFFAMLHQKGMLRRVYTQNIDGLEHQLPGLGDTAPTPHPSTGPEHEPLIVNVHGRLGGPGLCEFCGASYPASELVDMVRTRVRDIYNLPADGVTDGAPVESDPRGITCKECGKGGIKPSTVLYGRSLPEAFARCTKKDFPEK